MGNAQKPTTQTRHVNIKYFSLAEWVERDLMILERIDTSINISVFHRHANFLLGHIPPMYSPIYESTIGTYTNHTVDINHFVPPSFTTPSTAGAARIHAPIVSDYIDSPWRHVLGHGSYNPHVHRLSQIVCSHIISFVFCGGVTSDRIVDT